MIAANKKFYLTTAIPYTNARPHLGHALEFVQADAIARYHRILGEPVILLSGGDDNALKNVEAARQAGIDTQTFVDANAKLFQVLAVKLGVEFDVFQKGSDQLRHYPSSQKLWELCVRAGDIYKKPYEGLYCVGCEVFYTPDELDENGECPEHPGRKLDRVAEENYFFQLSKYQQELYDLIASDTLKVIPETRKNEALAFLQQPLQDISISRSNERARNWGIPVPGDDTQRIYVWFDGLNIYQSGIGFGWDEERYRAWWPADVHVIGKGILRFHAIYWPAFLLSAKLPLPQSLFVHGYITVDGQKMSKTVGNVIDPFDVLAKYGTDPVRYYLLREIPAYGDGDFSYKKFEERYNGELTNGLGNLVARVATLGERVSPLEFDFGRDLLPNVREATASAFANYERAFSEFRLNETLAETWRLIGFTDRYLNAAQPWALPDGPEFRKVIANAGYVVSTIANLLRPFLPQTADKIQEQIRFDDAVVKITKGPNLFPRLG